MVSDPRPTWRAFVLTSLAFALTAGFGLGAGLFIVTSVGTPSGPWWPAAAQAHGHVQIAGWAGLMVLGVALHFVPRLSGAAPINPRYARVVLCLFGIGLAARIVVQPVLAWASDSSGSALLRAGLVASALVELAGGVLAAGLLVRVLWHSRSGRKEAAIRPLIPFFLTAFTAFVLLLALNLTALISAAGRGQALTGHDLNRLIILVGFYGFLIPVSVAMSARTFPLYFRTAAPRFSLLHLGLTCLLAGLAIRTTGELSGTSLITGPGLILQAVALALFIAGLGVFASRRPLPRRAVRTVSEPIDLHALTSYAWLSATAVWLAIDGMAALDFGSSSPASDLETHLLGAGFITVLILGVGAHLLPGFARQSLRSRSLSWLTLVLVNLAVVLRIAPDLISSPMPARLETILPGTGGIAALLAIAVFAINTGVVGVAVPLSAARSRRTNHA